MSSNSIFGSLLSENRWLMEMNQTFPKENVQRLDLTIPPCVFRVPNGLSETKPEAYAPQKVGLGPYHHLRPDLYTMQRKKLDDVMKFLDDEQLQNFQLAVEALMQLEPFVRASYDQYLDLDPRTLAWILTIDAIYLLQFLKSYRERNDEDAPEMEKMTGDILMLENQIPVFLLMEVRRILKLSIGDGDEYALVGEFSFFCEEVSPLKLNNQLDDIVGMMRQGHLLNVMYYLIVTNRGIRAEAIIGRRRRRDEFLDDLSSGAEILAAANVPGAAIVSQQLTLMRKVPWGRILGLCKSGDQNPSVEEIDIPSVSQLTGIAGIRFALTQGGIRDVKFDDGEKKLYLPVITLRSNSEVILRNLLAYEAASVEPGSTLELAEYVDLMCGIVDTPKDVDILRKDKIIISDLTDAEIATIFNGIKKSTGDKEEKTTNIEKAIEKVNEQYDKIPRIKVYKFTKKHAPAIGKFLTVFSVILVLALFVFQAFCQIYGCSQRWFKK